MSRSRVWGQGVRAKVQAFPRGTSADTKRASWTRSVALSDAKRGRQHPGVGFRVFGSGDVPDAENAHGRQMAAENRRTSGGTAALRQGDCRGRNHCGGSEKRRTRFANKNLRGRFLPRLPFRISSGGFLARCGAMTLAASRPLRRGPRSTGVASRGTRIP
jgi:hypothetical protein